MENVKELLNIIMGEDKETINVEMTKEELKTLNDFLGNIDKEFIEMALGTYATEKEVKRMDKHLFKLYLKLDEYIGEE